MHNSVAILLITQRDFNVEANLIIKRLTELGIEKSSGLWIQFLDADDILYPSKISHQINLIKKFINYHKLYSNYSQISIQPYLSSITFSSS